MTEEQIKKKKKIERQLDKLVKQEEILSRRLHILLMDILKVAAKNKISKQI